MRAVDFYIFRQLAVTTLGVGLTLTFAIWLTQSLRLFDFIVNRGLPADQFLVFAGLLMPSFLGVVLPVAAFASVLFVYNKLIIDSELVVLRAAGLSFFQLARPAILLGLVVTALCYLITLYLLPASFREFKDRQWSLRSDYSTVLLQEGIFAEVEDGLTVYVRARTNDGTLLGVMVHDSRDPQETVTLIAERGALVDHGAGPVVILLDGSRQEMVRESGKLSVLNFDRYAVELGTVAHQRQSWRWREPKERFMSELLRNSTVPEDVRYRRELVAEAHMRVVTPLYAFAFVLVGLAAMLCGEFSRRGQTKRILGAVACVGVLEGLMLSVQDLAVRYPEAIVAMYLAGVLPSLFCGYLLFTRSARKRRRAALPA
jgi:lipopolysaccharide export system permease protein